MEPTATVNTLSAGIARAAELQSVLDHLGKYSKFLQAFLALGLAASEANSIANAVFVSMDQIYKLLQEQHKCDVDITALLQDMIDVLACITDVEQFAKSAQLKQAMEEVNPIVRATGNFITKYSTQSLKSKDPFPHSWHRDKGKNWTSLPASFGPSDINLTVVSLCSLE
ncbi:hypothetical protein B0H14DRAFT_277399 [Mycena olivaceomarginata]|nr:hypothetical protein B0H14DRAFT_277399 [Mycena olivaceomarginata]